MPHIKKEDQKLTSAGNWDSFWSKNHTNGKISWSKKRILAILEKEISNGCAVMDAGCGSGFFSNWFIENRCKTVALDYSSAALEATRTATAGKADLYLSDDLTDPSLPERVGKKFDIIFSDGLFEHFALELQDKILSNMKKLLTPTGKIISFVPNLWSPWTIIRPFLMPGITEKPFTISRLTNLYRRNGCEIDHCGGINTLPIALSPEFLGKYFGMLLYVVGKNQDV